MRQIVAMGGSGFFGGVPSGLDRFVVELASNIRSAARPKVCFVGTATGDAPEYALNFHRAYGALGCETSDLGLFARTVGDLQGFLEDKDAVYVGGGNTVSLLAVWRAHGLDTALRSAYGSGTILCGSSAGMNCWFEASVTDSFDLARLDGVRDGLGILSGSACPHYDGEAERRPTLHRLLAGGFPACVAAENDVALHYKDEVLAEVVTTRAGATAYLVRTEGGAVVEERLQSRLFKDVPA